jgi:hypothetical protein
MFLSLIVVDKQLSILSVAARLLASTLDDGEDRVCLAEDGVHLLQRAIGGFWIKEVDDWNDEGVAAVELVSGFAWRSKVGELT